MYEYDNPRNGDLLTRVINHFLYKVGWSKSQQKLTNMDVDNNHIWSQTRWPLGPMLEKDPSQGGWASCWRPILIVQNGRTLVTWVHLQHVDNGCMIMRASTKAMRFQNAQNPRGQTNQQEGLYWHLSFSGTCTNKILANKWQTIRHFLPKLDILPQKHHKHMMACGDLIHLVIGKETPSPCCSFCVGVPSVT